MGSNKDNEILTLDQLETELAQDTKVKLAGIDIDGTRSFLFSMTFADSLRDPPGQAGIQKEVPLRGKRWLWLLQRHLWLGYARPDLLPRTGD